MSPPTAGAGARTRVLYVGGLGRSGSTLLDRLLGQLPEYCAVGELVYLWDHSLRRDHDCGCGEGFRDCSFWSEVGRVAFGGWGDVDPDDIVTLQRSIDRTSMMPLLVLPWLHPETHRRLQRYVELMERIYGAIQQVSGAQVVVDSSKYPPPVFILRHARRLDLCVVHIVRDPRGVAYSWAKKVRRPEKRGSVEEYMPVWSTRLVSRRWATSNLLMNLLSVLGTPVLRLRYEDLVRDPDTALHRVARFAHTPLPAGALHFLDGGSAHLEPNHTADGNPMRFTTGRIEIRADEAWRQGLPAHHRRSVERLTWPLRRFYGYRRATQASQAPDGA